MSRNTVSRPRNLKRTTPHVHLHRHAAAAGNRDRLASLRAKAEEMTGELGEPWRPEAGQVLAGTIEGYTNMKTVHGGCVVATVADEQGVLHSVWIMAATLRREFQEHHPRVGDAIAIKCLGKYTIKSGRGAGKEGMRYKLLVEGTPADVPDFLASAVDQEFEDGEDDIEF